MIEARAYGALDRLLHRIALSDRCHGIALQKKLADLEDDWIAADAAAADLARPVFITALPRAGTTLLLNLLSKVPAFATHTYRDMPFLLAPVVWHRLSRGFRRPPEVRERAHGDGMTVGYDSPEAFEEIIWQAFWRGKYRADHIELWTAADRDAGFEDFFRRHMAKLIAVRGKDRQVDGAGPAPTRYLSKNNANIARLRQLPAMFPDGRIVVPVREPRDHCRSLLRQHRRFSAMHAEDDFARQYMRWLGHFEFGGDLRPILLDDRPVHAREDSGCLDFWLQYWIDAYRAIMDAADDVVLVDYAALCNAPRRGLERLADALEIEEPAPLLAQAAEIGQPRSNGEDAGQFSPALLHLADQILAAAREKCVNRPRAQRHGRKDAVLP